MKQHGRRGAILDRQGRPLALTAMAHSVVAEPRLIDDPEGTWAKLSAILALGPLPKALRSKRSFLWVRRHISPDAAQKIKALKLKGIRLDLEPHRHYPKQSLAGALLGFVDLDGRGREGLEKSYDDLLRAEVLPLELLRSASRRTALTGGLLSSEELSGHDLLITLHSGIQQICEEHLYAQVKEMRAKGGVVVVMDPKTGDLLAMAQTPAFDPNLYRVVSDRAAYRNHALEHVVEPGSTIKPILVAAALDAKKTRKKSSWSGFRGKIKVGRYWIRDVHVAKNNRMTTLEIIQHSSNVGATQVAQLLGKQLYYRYLRSFGFGESTDLGLSLESSGRLRPARKWGQIHLATFSYGYGLSVTPLQMVRAYSAIANGGVLMRPRLLKALLNAKGQAIKEFPVRPLHRIISERAARDVTEGMFMVTQEGGTGRRAQVPGHKAAGKTGTAHLPKLGGRGYDKNRVRASFVGFLPLEDPRLVIYVAIDEPRKQRYGGLVAGPVFSKIAQQALPLLGISNTLELELEQEELGDEAEAAEGIEPQAQPWWFVPGNLNGAPTHLLLPDFKGQALSKVLAQAAELGLKLRFKGAGQLRSQRPQAGALIPQGAEVELSLAPTIRRPKEREIR